MGVPGFIAKNAAWLVSALFVLAVLLACDLPVFWDMYGQVKTAHYFLEQDFSDLLPNEGAYSDNGHMPLYPLYLALLFKIFGTHLCVAHLSVLPFLIGMIWQLHRFAIRFLDPGKALATLLLAFFHPAVITQALYFSQEIALAYCALWLINALLYGRGSHIALASVALCLLNLRGIALCGVLLLYFAGMKKDRNAWYLLCGMIAWLAWAFWHYALTGWFFSGDQIREYRKLAPLAQMTRNSLISLWKAVDLGSLFAWAVVLVVAIKTKVISEPLRILALVTAAVMITCIPTTNPVSNRYFLAAHVLVLPVFMHALGTLPKQRRWLIGISFVIVLVSNNGVTYPNRYGNAWDCSLKSMSYFELRKEFDAYVNRQQIAPHDIAAGFQLYFNDKYYLLNGNDREYALLSDHEMPVADYVADSNICNNFNGQREKYLEQHYVPVQLFKRGAVYIKLYKKTKL